MAVAHVGNPRSVSRRTSWKTACGLRTTFEFSGYEQHVSDHEDAVTCSTNTAFESFGRHETFILNFERHANGGESPHPAGRATYYFLSRFLSNCCRRRCNIICKACKTIPLRLLVSPIRNTPLIHICWCSHSTVFRRKPAKLSGIWSPKMQQYICHSLIKSCC